MRWLAPLLVCVLVGHAQAQPDALGPPSKTLERAIKLYDKKDFLSASIELQKVLAGESGDDEQNQQRAGFFAGKTAYQMALYGPAWSRFASITSTPEHPYFVPAAKWLAALLRISPGPAVRGALFAYRGTSLLDEPELASVRDELALHLGRELAARDVPVDEVLATLARVSPASPQAPLAELERARVMLRARDLEGGIVHAMAIARMPAYEPEAARLVASWTHLHRAPARALAPLAQLPSAYARYQRSRAMLDGKPELPGLGAITIEAFDAVMLPAACRARGADDIKPLAREVITAARPVVADLLAQADNADLFERIAVIRGTGSTPGGDVVRAMLADPTMQERFAWRDEIGKELGQLQAFDRAWQTTPAAGAMLEELTVLHDVEATDIGAHARQRLTLLARDLEQLDGVLEHASPAFALSAGPDVALGQGLVIGSELCIGGGTAPIQAQAMRPRSGCGGCASREASPSLFVLGLVAFVTPRRRARPRERARLTAPTATGP